MKRWASAVVVCVVMSMITGAALAGDDVKGVPGSGGLCVVLGDSGPATAALMAVGLAQKENLQFFVQCPKAEDVTAIRRAAEKAGYLGSRIFVEQGSWARIHLADNLADVIIVGESARGEHGVPRAELLRILRPEGKALAGETQLTKPFPKNTDDWSHPYHGADNNPQSKDQVARGPFLTHFLAEPWYAAMPQMTVVSGGRIFKAFGNRTSAQPQWPVLNSLMAFSAFNGAMLWKRDLTPGFMVHRNTLVATPKTLFFGDDISCKLIDAATGKVTGEVTVPAELSDGPVWKWMALEDGLLYALVGEKEPLETTVRTGGFRGAGWPWWGIKNYPYGFGRTILAIDPGSKKIVWHHREQEPLDGRAMCVASGRLFFYSHQKFLGALDTRSGKVLWKTSDDTVLKAIGEHKNAQNPGEGFSSSSYVKCSDKALFFAGPTRSKLLGVSAETGKLLWQHEDGNFQLVLRNDGLYALGRGRAMVGEGSLKLDPITGEILTRFASRDRCTRATGCVDSIFTRGGAGGSTAIFDVTDKKPSVRVLSPMRPACQDGVVVAHGQLYWGPWMCRCDLTQIGLICLEPAGALDVQAKAVESERLETVAADVTKVTPLAVEGNDWPTYRKDNARSTRYEHTVGESRPLWEFKPAQASVATAPVAVGGLVFVSGADGTVRALDAATGQSRWQAYTSGAIKYPPSIWNGRCYVGSGDGWVYCFEAATGELVWRFRAAPAERFVPIFNSLISTWPVASGVLVEDGVAYAAAGTFNYNGTHVYALDAVTGKIRWQNNTSGNYNSEGGRPGPGVQGHLLLHKQSLCLAGGNTSAVASYNTADGKYSGGAGGGGKDLYVGGDQVKATGFPLYWRQEDSHFISLVELAAPGGNLVVSTNQIALFDVKADLKNKPKPTWASQPFQENAAVTITKNAVLVAGLDRQQDDKVASGICALDVHDGKLLWKQPLPAAPVSFGMAVDRDGRILVSLQDGRVLAFGGIK